MLTSTQSSFAAIGWKEANGPLYGQRVVEATGAAGSPERERQVETLQRLSFASELILGQAPSGAEVTVLVRVK